MCHKYYSAKKVLLSTTEMHTNLMALQGAVLVEKSQKSQLKRSHDRGYMYTYG